MECRGCELKKYGNPVEGCGPLDARTCLLGCNPCFRDADVHRPFASSSHWKLLEGLAEARLLTLQCWMTNVVKCPTPPGVLPPKESYEICTQKWLWKELGVLKKLRAILCFGSQTLFCFRKGKRVDAIHGRFFETTITINNPGKSVIILPTFHPSQAVREGRINKMFLEDMTVFGKLLRELG